MESTVNETARFRVPICLAGVSRYFSMLKERDWGGLPPSAIVLVKLPVCDKQGFHPDLFLTDQKGFPPDPAGYFARRYAPLPVSAVNWDRAIKYLTSWAYSPALLDRRAAYRIPLHTLLDIALFLGSDDLLNVWARRLALNLKYMNAPRVLAAIATHSMTPELIRQGRFSDALLEAFDAARGAFVDEFPDLASLTNEQLFMRIRSPQAVARGFRLRRAPPTGVRLFCFRSFTDYINSLLPVPTVSMTLYGDFAYKTSDMESVE